MHSSVNSGYSVEVDQNGMHGNISSENLNIEMRWIERGCIAVFVQKI